MATRGRQLGGMGMGLVLAWGLAMQAWAAPAGVAPVRVFVSIPPQKQFVERIGGDAVEVTVLLGPGQSPHSYDPTPKQLVKLQEAEVYFRVGVPFESTIVDKLQSTFQGLNIVDTRAGIDLAVIDEPHEHGHDHEHGPGCIHEPGELDPHIWMDPQLVRVQARTIAAELIKLRPAAADTFRANLQRFDAELESLCAELGKELAPLKGRRFYVYHPAYGYFARAFGLTQVAVESEGKAPTAKQLAELITRAKADNVRLIIVQPQFSKKNAETVAHEIGGAVVAVDPLAEDYVGMLRELATQLHRALPQ